MEAALPLPIPLDVDLDDHPTRHEAQVAFGLAIDALGRDPEVRESHIHWLLRQKPAAMNDDGWILVTHPSDSEATLAGANEAMVRLGHKLRSEGLGEGVRNVSLAKADGSANPHSGTKEPRKPSQPSGRQPWERRPVFMPAFLASTTLPHRDPKVSEFTRVNGSVRTTLVSTKRTGLPFGVYPRLIIVQLATAAVRTKRRRFPVGRSINDLLLRMGIGKSGGGGQSTLARDQLNRLCTTSFITTHLSKYGGHKLDIADRWMNAEEGGLVVELSERFFLQATKSAVPLDPFILRCVRRSPLSIDVYGWITYRMATLEKPTSIAWPSLENQFGSEYARPRDFRQRFREAVDRVRAAWPGDLHLELETRRVVLTPGPPSVGSRTERHNAKHH